MLRFVQTNSPTLARHEDGLEYIRILATPPIRLVFWDGAPSSYKWYQSHAWNLVVCVVVFDPSPQGAKAQYTPINLVELSRIWHQCSCFHLRRVSLTRWRGEIGYNGASRKACTVTQWRESRWSIWSSICEDWAYKETLCSRGDCWVEFKQLVSHGLVLNI